MSQVFSRGRVVAYGLTPRPPVVLSSSPSLVTAFPVTAHGSVGVRPNFFRDRAVQQRSYSTPQATKQQQPKHMQPWTPPAQQQPRTAITQAILDMPSTPKMVDHLNRLFAPLEFPPELAARILVHTSHKDAAVTNNARLGFLGALHNHLYVQPHTHAVLVQLRPPCNASLFAAFYPVIICCHSGP
jgi:hypothetical protein